MKQFKFCWLILSVLLPSVLFAQLISIKTVPVATGDQFVLLPSKNFGMGGVCIAMDDAYLDPFVNSAKGVRNHGARFFMSPALYSITGNNGGARSLPFSAHFGGQRYFGSAAFSFQQLESTISPDQSLSARYAENLYFYGSIGKRFDKNRQAVSLGLNYANLSAMQGVEFLYASSRGVKQKGSLADLRLGYVNEISNQYTFETVLLYTDYNMMHEVDYSWGWDWVPNRATEKNPDHTRTFGFHLGHVFRPEHKNLALGGIFTSNWKTHPKIPNYELMNIPRDPGNSYAYNIGLGISSAANDSVSAAIDFIYEPMWSNTWAEAAEEQTSASGQIIRPGDYTVENDFKFSNWILRAGMTGGSKRGGFQLGIIVKQTNYILKQYNYVTERLRKQSESWVEWMPTWSLFFHAGDMRIQYAGRVTMGSGQPGIANNWGWIGAESDASVYLNDIMLAPSGSLTLNEAFVFTHQVTVTVPF